MQASDRWILAGALALAVGSMIASVAVVESWPESTAWLEEVEARVAWKKVAPSNVPPAKDYVGRFHYNRRVSAGPSSGSPPSRRGTSW